MRDIVIVFLCALSMFLFMIVFMWAYLGVDARLAGANHVDTTAKESSRSE